ncbi:MAG: hypothetical protein KJ832_22820 [Gammaproteobacteria bacterium]|nr:hypothetical protein [Gammaproteobacteria bacterium]
MLRRLRARDAVARMVKSAQNAIVVAFRQQLAGMGTEPTEAQLKRFAKLAAVQGRMVRSRRRG